MEANKELFDLLLEKIVTFIDHPDPQICVISNLGLLLYSELKASREIRKKHNEELSDLKKEVILIREQFFAAENALSSVKTEKDHGLDEYRDTEAQSDCRPEAKKRKLSQEALREKMRRFSQDSGQNRSRSGAESGGDHVSDIIDLVASAGPNPSGSVKHQADSQKADTQNQGSKPHQGFPRRESKSRPLPNESVEMHWLKHLGLADQHFESLITSKSGPGHGDISAQNAPKWKRSDQSKSQTAAKTAGVNQQLEDTKVQMPQSLNSTVKSSVSNPPTVAFAAFGSQQTESKPVRKVNYVSEKIEKAPSKKAENTLAKSNREQPKNVLEKQAKEAKNVPVNKTFSCALCGKSYKQFNGGVVKHLYETHRIPEQNDNDELRKFIKFL